MKARRRPDGLQCRTPRNTLLTAETQTCSPIHDTRSSPLKKALAQLEQQGMKADIATYASLMRWCGTDKALADARWVHNHMSTNGRDRNTFLANLLVQMYGKCGSVEDAWNVFSNMRRPDSFSWTFMIAAYAQNGHEVEALRLSRHMQMRGLKPNKFTFVPILSACANLRALQEGKRIHELIVASRFDSNVAVRNALVTMYGKCGSLKDARSVFDKVIERDVISWTAMIAAYAQNGQGQEALELFRKMEREGINPDRVTFLCIVDACASLANLEIGREIHERIVASEFESDAAVRNALVNMYGKCRSPKDARTVFDKMSKRDVISWTAMIAAYAQNGHGKEALELLPQMEMEAVKLNKITFRSILDACTSLASLEDGRVIHERIVANGFGSDLAIRTALVNMYGKCGSPKDARLVFDEMLERDVISWTAMIAAYAQNGQGKEALELFREMDLEGIMPNSITFLSILEACASLASLKHGRVIHKRIITSGFGSDVFVGTALVNMYGKCGNLEDARSVFDKMQKRNVVTWNAMITTYAQNGQGNEALDLFRQMDMDGLKPDRITFLSILKACSHAGLLGEGWQHFVSMSGDYGIAPLLEHYVCMIDLLGRAGCLDEAEDLINSMPNQPTAVAWNALLGACRIHDDVERGARAAKHISELDPKCASTYVLLSNIYSAAGRWDDAAKVRKAMEERGLKKQPGYSWIEVEGDIHEFFVGDTSHPQSGEIYAELQRLSRQMEEAGYVPDAKVVLHDVVLEEKEHMLCSHSEKLAIAFGLITTPHGLPLRIFKNLRVCLDCHAATKFISNVVGREIIVRDANRFHHFKQGVCSCGDYW